VVRKPSDEWSEIPALTFPTFPDPPVPAPPAPAPAPPVSSPALPAPVAPIGKFQRGRGRLQCKTVKCIFLKAAVARFDHKIFIFLRGGGGSMDVRYFKPLKLVP